MNILEPIHPGEDTALRQIVSEGMDIGITFTSFSVRGAEMTLGDVVELIEPLDRDSALFFLAALNWHCMWVQFTTDGGWRGAARELDALIEQLLPPSSRLNGRLIANDPDFAGPVSEIALLTLAGLVCRFAVKAGGISLDRRSASYDLFDALLGVQGGIGGKPAALWQMDEMFSRTTRVVWRNISLQNRLALDLARLHAYLTIPEIASGLNEPVSKWFERHLRIRGEDYEAIANSLHGAASLRANFSTLFSRFPEVYRRMSPLVELCTTTPEDMALTANNELTLGLSDPDAINEAQCLADQFFRWPLLEIGAKTLCLSSRLLFNRLHRSLHYLIAEVYRAHPEMIRQVRAECGKLFERYILWLLTQFLPAEMVEIIHSFRIQPEGGRRKGTEPPERDIALITDDVAFLFEIKSAVPNLAHRRRAEVADFVDLLGPAVLQVTSAADALLGGNAFRDIGLTRPLPRVERVVPCVVCFEPLPLLFPVAKEVEDAISTQVKTRAFQCTRQRTAVQFFHVDAVEEFGDIFGLPLEWNLLLDAIIKRSLYLNLRYKPLSRQTGTRPGGHHPGSAALPKLLVEAKHASRGRWRELTSVIGSSLK